MGAGGTGTGGSAVAGAAGSSDNIPPPICPANGGSCGATSCYFFAEAPNATCLGGQDPSLKSVLTCSNSGFFSSPPKVTMMGGYVECCYVEFCGTGRPLMVDDAPRLAALQGRRDWAA